MKNTKHTAGPWQWDEPKNWHGLEARVFVAEPYGVIAQVPIEAWRPKSIGRANARLIAAAPQMLEALKHLTGLIADLRNVYSNDASEFIMNKPSYKAAAEAIKLAEGDL